jgi:hypothetical protein
MGHPIRDGVLVFLTILVLTMPAWAHSTSYQSSALLVALGAGALAGLFAWWAEQQDDL